MDFRKKSHAVILLILAICSIDFSVKKKINIVFIGDSITQGENGKAVPAIYTINFLEKKLGQVKFSNQGVSGCTTVDFLPSTKTHFIEVEKAAKELYADKQATLIFSIMLGTNDSAIEGPLGSPVSPDSYSNNLKIIIDLLLKDYPDSKIIIHYPLWYSPNTYNKSKYLQEGLSRLQSYFPVINAIIKGYSRTNPGHVFNGDKKAFGFFKEHYLTYMQQENGQKGIFYLHPNEKGSNELGNFWGQVILKIAK